MIAERSRLLFYCAIALVLASPSFAQEAKDSADSKATGAAGNSAKSAEDQDAELLIKEQARRDKAKLIRKPLLKETPEEQEAEFKKIRAQLYEIISKGPLIGNKKNETLVKRGLELMILRMSNKGEEEKASEYSGEVKYRYKLAGSRIPAAQRADHRARIARIIADNCEKLMDNQLAVRVSAVALMNGLILDIPKNSRPICWSNLPDYLLKIIKDDKQFVCVKITAISGLNVFLQCDKVTTTAQSAIAQELTRQLTLDLPIPSLEKALYHQGICRTLSRLNIPQPRTSQAVYQLLANKKNSIRARSAAAFCLGRLPVSGLNPEDIAVSSVQLMWEIGSSFNKAPDDDKWFGYAGDTYLAFRHANADEKKRKAGLMNRAATVKVQKAFELVVPVIAHLARDARLGDDDERTSVSRDHLKKMKEWVDTQTGTKDVASR